MGRKWWKGGGAECFHDFGWGFAGNSRGGDGGEEGMEHRLL